MNFEYAFFDKKTYKEYQLYAYISSSERKSYTTGELAKQVDLSSRVTHTLLENMIERLSKTGNQELTIHKNVGITVSELSYSIDEYRVLLLQDSIVWTYFLHLIHAENVTLEAFCETHYMSPSTLYRRIKPLSAFLKAHDIEIAFAHSEFIGDEKNIRMFLFCMFWLGYRGVSWPFKAVSAREIEPRVSLLEKMFRMNLNEVSKTQFQYFFAICYVRIKQNYWIKPNVDFNQICLNNPYFDLDLFEQVLPECAQHIIEESQYIFFIMNFKPVYFEKNAYIVALNHYYEQQQNEIYHYTQYFLSYLMERLNRKENKSLFQSQVTLANLYSLNLGNYIMGPNFINLFPLLNHHSRHKEDRLYVVLTEFFECLEGTDFKRFYALKEQLISYYYDLFYFMLKDTRTQNKLRIGLILDSNSLYKGNLIQFLKASPYPLEIVFVKDSQDPCDLYIASSYIRKKFEAQKRVYYWNYEDELANYGTILEILYSIYKTIEEG